jgi:hypothetical protein
MNIWVYLIIASIVWETNFNDKKTEIKKLENYQIEIYKTDDGVTLKGNPQEEGFSSAWFYIPENVKISTYDTLFIKIKVLKNTVRLRYFLLSEDKRVYFLGIKYIPESENWQEIKIPLENVAPFYSSNFPWCLMPDKMPSMYLFIENQVPGKFLVKINRVKIKGGRK